jgi:hypothetical protein
LRTAHSAYAAEDPLRCCVWALEGGAPAAMSEYGHVEPKTLSVRVGNPPPIGETSVEPKCLPPDLGRSCVTVGPS